VASREAPREGNDEEPLVVDARGLMCPLPLLRLKKALSGLHSGDRLRIETTDPAAELDFGVFLEQMGHTLLERSESQGVQSHLIRKK
jgi:tRNA 2-thiouridine synthesizing protein A